MSEMKEWIEQHLMTNGKLISRRLNDKWFIKNSYTRELAFLKSYNASLTKACQVVLGLVGHCKQCGSYGVISPREYCSLFCANKSSHRSANISKSWTKEVAKKRKATMLSKYGKEHNLDQEKIRRAVLKKYGVDNVSRLDTVKQKKKATVESWTPEFKQKRKDNFDSSIHRQHYTKELNEELDRGLPNITGVNDPIFAPIKSLATVYRLVNKHRPELISDHNTVSSLHKEILSILDEADVEYIVNDRKIIKPKEIDIYIPSMKLGFEFNGTYWHSVDRVGTDYHQKKSILAKEKGITLVHLYEFDGFERNKEIVLEHITGTYKPTPILIGDKVCYDLNRGSVLKECTYLMADPLYNKEYIVYGAGFEVVE